MSKRVFLFFSGLMALLIGVLLRMAGVREMVFAPLLFGGIALMVFYLFLDWWSILESLRDRAKRRLYSQVFYIIFVSIAVVFLLLLCNLRTRRFDFTENKRFTLDKATLEFLKGLDEEVTVVCFYGSKDMLWEVSTRGLLEQFSNANDKVHFIFADPNRTPETASKFAGDLHDLPSIFVQRKDKYVKASGTGEEDITNAIVKATRKGTKTIGFITGHGERDSTNITETYAIGQASERLEEKGFHVKRVEIGNQPGSLEGCDALIIAAPRNDPYDSELEALDLYLRAGHGLLILLEPELTPKLATWLGDYGLKIGDDIVCETKFDPNLKSLGSGKIVGQLSISIQPSITQRMYPVHNPITRNFELTTQYPTCRSVSVRADSPNGVTVDKILETLGDMPDLKRPGSWAETDLVALKNNFAQYDEGVDAKGPITIAALSTLDPSVFKSVPGSANIPETSGETKHKGKILVFGDSDFITNASGGYGGEDLFINAVSYLSGDETLIQVRHKPIQFTELQLSDTQQGVIITLAIVLWPLVTIVFGIVMAARRRRA